MRSWVPRARARSRSYVGRASRIRCMSMRTTTARASRRAGAGCPGGRRRARARPRRVDRLPGRSRGRPSGGSRGRRAHTHAPLRRARRARQRRSRAFPGNPCAIFAYAPPVRRSPPPSSDARAPRPTTPHQESPPRRPGTRRNATHLAIRRAGALGGPAPDHHREGYTEPTPVQERAIPLVLQGRDVLGAAQTGTGKTAAFTLPILDRLKAHANTSFSPARHPVRCSPHPDPRAGGPGRRVGQDLRPRAAAPQRRRLRRRAAGPQIKELRAGVEILVATPGRLLDLVGQRAANLGQVEILVLDEADRMLDMGFIPDIRRILDMLPHASRSCCSGRR